MKLLILHQHFKLPVTGGAIRSYYLAKALADQGHEVVVFSGHNTKNTIENYEGITIQWLRVPYDNRFRFARRAWAFLSFIIRCIFNIRGSSFQYCYAISTPITTGIIAIWLRLTKGLRFTFEVGDLWPDAPIELGFVRGSIAKWLLRKLERSIYSQATSLVALSEPMATLMRKRSNQKPVLVIPNMADTDFFRPHRDTLLSGVQTFTGSVLVVSYIGALGYANGLEWIPACAGLCKEQSLPIRFLVCGDGAYRDYLIEMASSHNLTNLEVLPFQNRDGVRNVLNSSDCILVSFRPEKILQTGSPNKYFDGLAAGKAVLTNVDGWIRKEVEEHECGFYFDRDTPTDFVNKIRILISDRDLLSRYQANARRLAVSTYSRTRLGEKFVKELFEPSATLTSAR